MLLGLTYQLIRFIADLMLVGAGADQDEVDDEEAELVRDAEKHARGTRPATRRSAGAAC